MGPVRTDDSGGAQGGWKWGDGGLAVLPWPLLQLLPEELMKAKHYVRVPSRGAEKQEGTASAPPPAHVLGWAAQAGAGNRQAGPQAYLGTQHRNGLKGKRRLFFDVKPQLLAEM